MIRVGIVGFGFMGKIHFQCYQQIKNVKIAAVCDAEIESSIAAGTLGHIRGSNKVLDLSGIALYSNFDKMLKEQKLDAVSITLPTFLHCRYTVKSLKAGLHTLCEKPMAMTINECEKMLAAAKKYKKILQIGHCIRFWPEYVYLRNMVNSGKYGKVLAATFRRLSYTPILSWKNWFMDSRKSGGAVLDLHIHDSDFVQYLFGPPKKVFSRGAKGPSKGCDHIVTRFLYDDDKVVTAEGRWTVKKNFRFEMSFNVMLQKATISFNCTQTPTLKIATDKGKIIVPKLPETNGYMGEIQHFIKAVSGKKVPPTAAPEDSLNSVKIVLAERKSAQTGKPAALNFREYKNAKTKK
jgi:predicted dehydrogenase